MSVHVGSRLIFFLSVVGNFLRVLSVVGNIFLPFVASRLTPFTPSEKISITFVKLAEPLHFNQIWAPNFVDTVYNNFYRRQQILLLGAYYSTAEIEFLGIFQYFFLIQRYT